MNQSVDEQVDVGDVLIVGAGVTGTLLAYQLIRDGRSVTIVDRDGFGAGQSGHSHGYLHHGYIYRSGEKMLATHLRAGARRWDGILNAMDVRAVSPDAHVCFLNEITARAAASAWREAQLPVVRVSPEIPGLRYGEIQAAFRTSEATYDFTPFFAAARNALGPCTLSATVRRLERRGDRVAAVLADIGDLRVRLRARFVVLAAGDQNAPLAESATRFRGRAVVRSSLMLVLRHADLPKMSVVIPENEAHGLFIVSRQTDEEPVWLVSDFVSFADAKLSHEAREGWLRAIVQRLALYCTGVREPAVRWGLYDAPKAELRAQPAALGAHAFEDYAIKNLLALAPTKLTLAPLLAAEAAETIDERLDRNTASRGDLPGPHLAVCAERWTSISLEPRDQFFGHSERDDCRRTLLRHVRARSTFV